LVSEGLAFNYAFAANAVFSVALVATAVHGVVYVFGHWSGWFKFFGDVLQSV
jgi:hypothetical protein